MNYEELEKKVNIFFFVRFIILNISHLQVNSYIYNLVSHLLEKFQSDFINENYF